MGPNGFPSKSPRSEAFSLLRNGMVPAAHCVTPGTGPGGASLLDHRLDVPSGARGKAPATATELNG